MSFLIAPGTGKNEQLYLHPHNINNCVNRIYACKQQENHVITSKKFISTRHAIKKPNCGNGDIIENINDANENAAANDVQNIAAPASRYVNDLPKPM